MPVNTPKCSRGKTDKKNTGKGRVGISKFPNKFVWIPTTTHPENRWLCCMNVKTIQIINQSCIQLTKQIKANKTEHKMHIHDFVKNSCRE